MGDPPRVLCLLPQPWGAIGQGLPPGATGTLLRNIAFFDGAAIGTPLVVLGAWLVGGLLAFWAGAARTARSAGTARAAGTARTAEPAQAA